MELFNSDARRLSAAMLCPRQTSSSPPSTWLLGVNDCWQFEMWWFEPWLACKNERYICFVKNMCFCVEKLLNNGLYLRFSSEKGYLFLASCIFETCFWQNSWLKFCESFSIFYLNFDKLLLNIGNKIFRDINRCCFSPIIFRFNLKVFSNILGVSILSIWNIYSFTIY